MRRLSERQRERGRRCLTEQSALAVGRAGDARGARGERLRRGDHRHRLPAAPRADRASRESSFTRWRRRCCSRWRRVRPVAHARAGARRATSCEPKRGEHETWLLRKVARALRAGPRAARCGGAGLTVGVGVVALARRRRCSFTRLGAEFVPQLDEGDLLVEARRLPGVALDRVGRDRPARRRRPFGRSPRSSTSSASTGAPESRPIRWASSRATSTSGSRTAQRWRPGSPRRQLAREIAEAVERSRARDRRRRLAADPDAHERARRRRPLRRRGPDLRPRSRPAASARRAARPTSVAQGPRRRRRARRAGRGPALPAHRARSRQARALRPHRRRTSTSSPRRMAVGHYGRRGARGRAPLRHRRQDRRTASTAISAPLAGAAAPVA